MKRFAQILEKYGVIVEQPETPNIPNADVSAIPGAPQPEIDTQTPPTVKKTLEPASYVTLVRLLRDAFVARPTDQDSALVITLKFSDNNGKDTTEINETNADDAFKKLLPIISKYSKSDIGVKNLLDNE